MKTVKILIVENELLTAERMRVTLEKCDYTITAIVSTGEDAIKSVKSDSPDIVLMDVHLDGKIDGITTARSIKLTYSLPVIFITQWQDEEIFRNALETFPENFITKPFSDSTLLHAVELAIKHLEKPQKDAIATQIESFKDGVFIPVAGGANVKLLFKDILYIQAKGAYSDIYYEGKEKNKVNYHRVSLSSNHVIDQLAYPSLIKVHRSYHVNIQKIEKIESSSVVIQGKEIPVSEEHNNALKKMFIFFKR